MNVEMIAKTFQVWCEEEQDELDYEMMFTDSEGGYIQIGVSEELFQHIKKWLMTFPSKVSERSQSANIDKAERTDDS